MAVLGRGMRFGERAIGRLEYKEMHLHTLKFKYTDKKAIPLLPVLN
jgi:hypothetical protein